MNPLNSPIAVHRIPADANMLDEQQGKKTVIEMNKQDFRNHRVKLEIKLQNAIFNKLILIKIL